MFLKKFHGICSYFLLFQPLNLLQLAYIYICLQPSFNCQIKIFAVSKTQTKELDKNVSTQECQPREHVNTQAQELAKHANMSSTRFSRIYQFPTVHWIHHFAFRVYSSQVLRRQPHQESNLTILNKPLYGTRQAGHFLKDTISWSTPRTKARQVHRACQTRDHAKNMSTASTWARKRSI